MKRLNIIVHQEERFIHRKILPVTYEVHAKKEKHSNLTPTSLFFFLPNIFNLCDVLMDSSKSVYLVSFNFSNSQVYGSSTDTISTVFRKLFSLGFDLEHKTQLSSTHHFSQQVSFVTEL